MGARSVAWEEIYENGKVVRTRNVRPKSLEDTWNMEDVDKIKGQPWDPSVTLTYEKLDQDRNLKIRDPTPAEEEYKVAHDYKKGPVKGRRTQGCRKCRANVVPWSFLPKCK